MIIYFSGTGNSRYIAKSIGKNIEEEVNALTDTSPLDLEFKGNSLGIITPIYSWGIPPIVLQYIRNLNENFVTEVSKIPLWIILVCGDETGKAPDMIKKELYRRNLYISGGWSIQMPNNYVILPGFNVDSKELEKKKIEDSKSIIAELSKRIKDGNWEEKFVEGSMPRLKTSLIYPLFKRWGIFPNRWRHTDKCISCGKCAQACPVENITMKPEESSNKIFPIWGSNCTSCLACFHICPVNAVQYGNATKKKGQYFFKYK